MPFNLRAVLRNSSTRILVIIFFCLVAITGFFLVQGYFAQIKLFKEAEFSKLGSVARTLALQIDGDMHESLMRDYPAKDAVTSSNQDARYRTINELLSKASQANMVKSDIYTMIYNKERNLFELIVNSSEEPYYRHEWREFHTVHVEQYSKGANVEPYMDEHGTWISSFAPIHNSQGEVVAAVQVDEQFDEFKQRAYSSILQNALISLGVFVLVAAFLLWSIRSILLKEDALNAEILQQKLEIEQANKDITDSIHYARRIQEAILPSLDWIRSHFPESFVLFLPKDIVSGDFYWFAERNNRVFIAAVDCTGHGVPGAFMSMIGNTLLNDIVNNQEVDEPAEILNRLHVRICQALQQDDPEVINRDGMDLALCAFDKKTCTVEYAGAFRPLVVVRNGELVETKADKFPIGGGNLEHHRFTNHVLQCQPGDLFYMYSDGYPDQFGGIKGKKFMTKRFKQLLADNHHLPLSEQYNIYHKAFSEWCGQLEQVDDVLVIGLKVVQEGE